ncbi:hypothetical protein BDZ89DRAFT_1062351 [Hymenopellis radicata]|nr:hypothetical protein BDZ89DRAFT_1062351 [Hymenopellis radicata]
MPHTRPANPPKPCEYIFISVHYRKPWEWSADEFPSLRAGLEDFAREYSEESALAESKDPTLLERLLNMDDATLMHHVLALGSNGRRSVPAWWASSRTIQIKRRRTRSTSRCTTSTASGALLKDRRVFWTRSWMRWMKKTTRMRT